MAEQKKWPSRFWRTGVLAIIMAGTFVYLAMAIRPEVIQVAIGTFGVICSVVLGGGGAVNWKERSVWEMQAQAGQEPSSPGEG